MKQIAALLSVVTAVSFCDTVILSHTVAAADLGGEERPQIVEPVSAPGDWTFQLTPYGWLPWVTGDLTVKGRNAEVDVSPSQLIENLDWDGIPVWMSYMEARRGHFSLFNDIVYSKVSGSADFAKSVSRRRATATFGADVKADFEMAIIEAGAAYQVWSTGSPGATGATAFDILAGARYWYQNIDVSAELTTTLALGGPLGLTFSGNRAFARSGTVDWVDPFVGGRVRHQLAPGQEIVLRGDIGGFDAGSQFSWQVIGTYDWQLCVTNGVTLDGYLGYRALSVDYSQGSGTSEFELDAVMHGPVMGLSMSF